MPADTRDSHLRLATVSRGTREIYWQALLDFEKFCTDGKLSLLNPTAVDKALEIYFTDTFFNGYGPAEGRNALFGYIHFRTALDRNKTRPFPRASRCLRGWERQAPQHIRDPMPYGVVCMFGNHFLDVSRIDLAFCLALQFDCYLRPGEAASLHRSDILPPAPRAGRRYSRRWALLLGNSERGARTKTGTVDGSVVIGYPHREWVATATARYYRNAEEKLFAFDLLEYEAAFRTAATRLDLLALETSPHAVRHGAASHDKFCNLRTLPEIQKRGQWATSSSVARYEKHGKLLRQLHRLSASQQVTAKEAEVSFPSRLIWALNR